MVINSSVDCARSSFKLLVSESSLMGSSLKHKLELRNFIELVKLVMRGHDVGDPAF